MLTLYKNFGHFITSDKELLSSADLSSLIVRQDDQLILFEIKDPSKKSIIYKNNNKYEGIIEEISDNLVVFSSNKKIIRLKNYDYIESSDDKIRINIINNNNPVEISYLINNINYNFIYNLIINNNIINIYLYIMINNNLKEIIKLDKLYIVAGDINKNYSQNNYFPVRKSMKMMAQAAPMISSQAETSDVYSKEINEYIKYDLGAHELREKNLLFINNFENIEVKRIYNNILNNKIVNIDYLFINPDFFPSGEINLYEIKEDNFEDDYSDNDDDLSENHRENKINFIGASRMKEYQKDQKIKVSGGTTTKVVVETVLSEKIMKDKSLFISVESHIKNFEPEKIRLNLKYYIDNQTVKSACKYRIKDNYIIFEVEVDKEKNFKCEFTLLPIYPI